MRKPSLLPAIPAIPAIGLAILVLLLASAPVVADTAADGERVFKKCQACHSLDAGRHRAGPSLAGVFRAGAGSVDGYSYSPAMEDSGIIWDEENLDKFLASPREMMPGR